MNTSKPDALMQGIALQHYQELIPETRAVYISNAAKMEAYKKAYARVLQQLTGGYKQSIFNNNQHQHGSHLHKLE
jgi:hypothetical protein